MFTDEEECNLHPPPPPLTHHTHTRTNRATIIDISYKLISKGKTTNTNFCTSVLSSFSGECDYLMCFAGVEVCSGPASEQIPRIFKGEGRWQLGEGGTLFPDASLVLQGGDTWRAKSQKILDKTLSFLRTSGALECLPFSVVDSDDCACDRLIPVPETH